MAAKETSPNLNHDTIEEILDRLPVKSVLRFRSVSKTWKSLIDSTRFKLKHHNRRSNKCNDVSLFIAEGRDRELIDQFFLLQANDDDNLRLHDLTRDNVAQVGSEIEWVGLANGLVFLQRSSNVYELWNPATNEFRSAPSPKQPRISPKFCIEYGKLKGFGYDLVSEDYKFLQFYFVYPRGQIGTDIGTLGTGRVFIQLYSLSADAWKEVEIDYKPYKLELFSMDDSNVFNHITGVHYWFCDHYANQLPRELVSFDYHTEAIEFQSLQLTNFISGDTYDCQLFVDNEGIPGLIFLHHQTGNLVVYLRTNKDLPWIVKFKVILELPVTECAKGLWRDEVVVVKVSRFNTERPQEGSGQLVFYNRLTGTCRRLGCSRRLMRSPLIVFNYSESLFPLTKVV